MNDIIIIGAGGHARVLVDALRAAGRDVTGFGSKDDESPIGTMKNVPRIGDDSAIMALGARNVLLVNVCIHRAHFIPVNHVMP